MSPSSNEVSPPVSPTFTEKSPKEIKASIIEQRLAHIYRFAGEIIKERRRYQDLEFPVPKHLDIGTYKGNFLTYLLDFADKVYSIDKNPAYLWQASQRPQLKAAIGARRLALYEMDARHMTFPDNMFDSATCVEVLGAMSSPLEGGDEGLHRVISSIYRILAPPGIAVITFMNEVAQELTQAFDFFEGHPTSREDMERLLSEIGFSDNIDWYGQLPVRRSPQDEPLLPWKFTPKCRSVYWPDTAWQVYDTAVPPASDIVLPLYYIVVAEKPVST